MSLSEYRTHALEAHSARQRNARPVPKISARADGHIYFITVPPCPLPLPRPYCINFKSTVNITTPYP